MDKTYTGPPPEHPPANEPARCDVPRACKNCKFYGLLDGMNAVCRLDPPKLLPLRPKEGGGWDSVVAWPDINPETDWCAKFYGVRNWTIKSAPFADKAKSDLIDL